MFMEEVASGLELLSVEADDEVEVKTRLDELTLDDVGIPFKGVDPLPGTPGCTHRRPDEEEGLLLA